MKTKLPHWILLGLPLELLIAMHQEQEALLRKARKC
jgi:hypothetical protein